LSVFRKGQAHEAQEEYRSRCAAFLSAQGREKRKTIHAETETSKGRLMAQRYDLMVPRSGNDGKTYWTKVGVAFANKSGNGFNLSFEALPLPSKNDRGDYETRVIMMEPRPRQQQVGNSEEMPF
tara:strand:+ start:412 stop:783 length:372 start_codon:yes stop_codon:yes gene_type:complete